MVTTRAKYKAEMQLQLYQTQEVNQVDAVATRTPKIPILKRRSQQPTTLAVVPVPLSSEIGRGNCYTCTRNFGLRLNKNTQFVNGLQRQYCSEKCMKGDSENVKVLFKSKSWSSIAREDIGKGQIVTTQTAIINLPRVVDWLDFGVDTRKEREAGRCLKILSCVGCHKIIFRKKKMKHSDNDSERDVYGLTGESSKNIEQQMELLRFDQESAVPSALNSAGCLVEQDRAIECRECGWPLCSADCEKKFHASECVSLARLKITRSELRRKVEEDPEAAYLAHAIHRVWTLKEHDIRNHKKFMELAKLKLDIRHELEYQQKQKVWMEYLEPFGISSKTAWEIFVRVIGYRVNYHEHRHNRWDYGVYALKFSPSCNPNTVLEIKEGETVTLLQKSVVMITKGSKITVGRYQWEQFGFGPAYTKPLQSRLAKPRQGDKVNHKQCECSICSWPGDSIMRDKLYRRKCPIRNGGKSCKGFQIPYRERNPNFNWKFRCDVCKKELTGHQIKDMDKQGLKSFDKCMNEGIRKRQPPTSVFDKWMEMKKDVLPNYLLSSCKMRLASNLSNINNLYETTVDKMIESSRSFFKNLTDELTIYYPGEHACFFLLTYLVRMEKLRIPKNLQLEKRTPIMKELDRLSKRVGKVNPSMEKDLSNKLSQLMVATHRHV